MVEGDATRRDESSGRATSNQQPRQRKERTMGKLVVTEFISLDGVIEDPGGSEGFKYGGWTFDFEAGDEGQAFKVEELMSSDAQLLGRITYDHFAEAWPTMEGTGEFGEKMNSMPKYVVSSTLTNPEWQNTTVLGSDLASEVAALKERYDNILVTGSSQLVRGLFELDLVDELRLMIFPVLLGAGKRLFGDLSDKKRLSLVESRALGDGVTAAVFARS
jgi:dihydrofolate reductase